MTTPPKTHLFSSRWLPLVTLALITLVALGLRLWQIGESLWLDELHTSWVVIEGPGPIAHRAAMGNTSPVYFYAVWGVTQVFGHTEFTLRLLSLVAGVALVPLVYWVVVKATGQPAAGLLSAAMATLDPNGLFYSIEARPYALVELVGVVQVCLFWRLVSGGSESSARGTSRENGWRMRMAFVAASLLLFYLHYTTQLLLAAEVVAYALLCLRAERVFGWLGLGTVAARLPGSPFAQVAYRPLPFFLDLGLILAGQLVMLPSLLAVYHRRENWEAFVQPQPWHGIFTLFPLVIYFLTPLVALAVGYGIFLLLKKAKPKIAPAIAVRPTAAGLVLLAVCWFFVPVIVAWSATHFDLAAVFLRRYLMAAAAAPFVLAGLIYAAIPSRLARAGCWALALALLLGGDGVVTTGVARQFMRDGRFVVHSHEDWRGAIAWLNQQTQKQTHEQNGSVFVYAGLIEQRDLNLDNASPDQLEFFNFPVQGIYQLEAPITRPDEVENPLTYGIIRGPSAQLLTGTVVVCHWPRPFFDAYMLAGLPEDRVQNFAGITVISTEAFEKTPPDSQAERSP